MQVDMKKLWGKFWEKVELNHQRMGLQNEQTRDNIGFNKTNQRFREQQQGWAGEDRWNNRWARDADQMEAKNRYHKALESQHPKPPVRKTLRFGGIRAAADPFNGRFSSGESENPSGYDTLARRSTVSPGSGSSYPRGYGGGSGNSVGPVGFTVTPTTTMTGSTGGRKRKKLDPGPPPKKIPRPGSISKKSYSYGW